MAHQIYNGNNSSTKLEYARPSNKCILVTTAFFALSLLPVGWYLARLGLGNKNKNEALQASSAMVTTVAVDNICDVSNIGDTSKSGKSGGSKFDKSRCNKSSSSYSNKSGKSEGGSKSLMVLATEAVLDALLSAFVCFFFCTFGG